MKTGLEINNAVKTLQVVSNIFAGDGKGAGIAFTGNTTLDRVIIGNNTFYNLTQGVTFRRDARLGQQLCHPAQSVCGHQRPGSRVAQRRRQ